MNKCIFTGRLTKDPEVRYSQAGKCITSFTLAVDRTYSKEKKEVDFINCVAWEKLAETLGDCLNKGMKILVEGRLQIRYYEANDGQKKWVTEIVLTNFEFLESKKQQTQTSEKLNINDFGKDITDNEEISF